MRPADSPGSGFESLEPWRERAAVALLRSGEASFRRTARRVSICSDDAEDALQRAAEILLTKAPPHPAPRLAAWMHLVTRREALRVRVERERLLYRPLTPGNDPDEAEPLDRFASAAPCPAERYERLERARERARRLARLKPQERRALCLKAEGYSYAEICELTGWTYTKVNRCLAEGRARLRRLER
jgi:RNA polymerase sigma factor (sigma-70 family)